MVNDSQKYIYIERSKRIYGFLLILVRLDIDLFKKKKKKDIYEIYSILISYKNIILSPKLGNKAIFLNGLYGRASYTKKILMSHTSCLY